MATSYVFDNAAPLARARLTALATVFDPGTIRHLDALGVANGWRCLEVGGGLGTITRWLSARVGPTGSVLTTDIDPRHLDGLRLPNVDVRRHDVVDEDLPRAAFDLACTRLVLEHVREPRRALDNILKAVKPGGVVLVEDFEAVPGMLEPNDTDGEPITRTFVAMRAVAAAAGVDMRLGRQLARRLHEAGLHGVAAEGRTFLWRGGSPGTELLRLNFEQLRAPILATGLVSPEEFAADHASLSDSATEVRSPILWTAWGRRPER